MNMNVIQLKTVRGGDISLRTAGRATTAARLSVRLSLLKPSFQVAYIVPEGGVLTLEGGVLTLQVVELALEGIDCLIAQGNGRRTRGHIVLGSIALIAEVVALIAEVVALIAEVVALIAGSVTLAPKVVPLGLEGVALIAGSVALITEVVALIAGDVHVGGEGVEGGLHVAGVDFGGSSRDGKIQARRLVNNMGPRREVIEWDGKSNSARDRIETSRVEPLEVDVVAEVVRVVRVVGDGKIGEQIAVLLVGRVRRPGVGIVGITNEIPNVHGDLVKVHSSIAHETDEGMRILGGGDVVRSNAMTFQQAERLLAMAAGAAVADLHTEQTALWIVRRLKLGVVVVVAGEMNRSWSRHGDVLLWFAV